MLLLLPIAPHIGSVMRKRFPFSDAIIADHNKTRHVRIFFECAVYSEQTSPNTNRALNLLLNPGVIHSCLTQPNTIGPSNNLCYHYNDHNGRDYGSNQQPHITQPFIQAQIKENIKAPRHWPLWGKFTDDRWIPRTNGQWRGKCFPLMTSSCGCSKSISYLYLCNDRPLYKTVLLRKNNALLTLCVPIFFRENKSIYLHIMSLLHIDMTQAVEMPPQVRQVLTYSTQSISYLPCWTGLIWSPCVKGEQI